MLISCVTHWAKEDRKHPGMTENWLAGMQSIKTNKEIYTTLTNLSTKYLVQVIPWMSNCTGDYPLAKARELSPRTDGQTMILLVLNCV